MKIAVFFPNWVGDAVMATPALRALRQHFATARLLGVLRPNILGVFEGSPWLDEVMLLSREGGTRTGWAAVAARLRRERVELALLFPNTFRSAWVAWLGGCRRRVGYARYGRSFLLTDALPPRRDSGGRLVPSPIIDAYGLLVAQAGVPRPSTRLELFTTPRDESAADAVWDRARWNDRHEVICLNPGAAFGAAKCWPAEYFARLASELAERRGCGVLVLCGPRERDLARGIQEMAAHPAVHSLADAKLDLGLTKACVRRCHLLVTTDSGPRHFAAAFDKPVITLFGPTHIAWTETYHPKAVHLQKSVPCGPCQLRTCPLDHRCMRLLSPAEVFATAENVLQQWPPRRMLAERKAS